MKNVECRMQNEEIHNSEFIILHLKANGVSLWIWTADHL
jgi:hypothetical protein